MDCWLNPFTPLLRANIILQCTTGVENYLVAHYDLKPPDVRAYGVSGNNLTIYESFIHLSVGEWRLAMLLVDLAPNSHLSSFSAIVLPSELLASLIIMRHIAQHNL